MNKRAIRRVKVLFGNLFDLPKRVLFTKISVTVGLQSSKVDRTAAILGKTKFYRSVIGRMSYVGKQCYIESATIGRYTSISNNCFIGGASHPIQAVSMSPIFHQGDNVLKTNYASHKFEPFLSTTIGNDVWIGEGGKLKAGITIGDGAVVGMGSVVTKSIGAYEIWAGNPARFIRKRFDEETIARLLNIRWWQWNEEKITQYAPYFGSPQRLFEEIDKQEGTQ